jgi:hypothetical protein
VGCLVGSAQFGVLLAEPAQFFGLGGGGPVVALAAVGLGLADPVPQRFMVHAQLLGQAADHWLRVRLSVEPDRALTRLVGTSLIKLIFLGR